MNLHPPSVLEAEASVRPDALTGRVWVFLGAAMLSMSADEAGKLAGDLVDAARVAAPLVTLDGLQPASEDIVPTGHATLGAPA